VTTLYKKKFMAINVNTIYQRVLAIANKEQRGYVTPQEYNVFANAAQADIFEQYFYDLNQFMRRPGNDTRFADTIDNIEEKISLFEKHDVTLSYDSDHFNLPSDLYKINAVTTRSLSGSDADGITSRHDREVTNVSLKDLKYILVGNLTKPTNSSPIYVKNSDGIVVYGGKATQPFYETKSTSIKISYIKNPATVKWGFVMVNNEPLYNPGGSTDFELHASEQRNLVNKILQLAGISMESGDIYQASDKEDIENLQNEKL
jgi:hypothetical protein